ncbi:anaerobic ribonucleoside-triphosphate reductase [Aquabacterium sp.]|uniref:anaerobic ribonucleoside-triphosphate reductase n=1 Tax=Aquabacterium sp. TaxID=1872578 RepID=UPI0035B203DC
MTRFNTAAHPVLADHERQRCEIWTRVMGYHRPVASFNTGKKGEFAERVYFCEPGRAAPGTPSRTEVATPELA